MAKKSSLIYLNTSGNSKPIGLLKLGELAIQHNTPKESRIYIDTASDTTGSSESTIVEFVPKSYVDDQINMLLKFIENPELIKYYCLDSEAMPVIVNDGYVFDSGVTEITPCTYDLSNITVLNTTDGASIFPSGLTSITANMESLETTNLNEETIEKIPFMGCKNLKEVNLYLPNLTDGSFMFYGFGMLYGNNSIELNAILPNLSNGSFMFAACTLDNWNIELPKLIDGTQMFITTKFKDFSVDLASLTNGMGMFYGCNSLTSFTSDLSSLTNGNSMFDGCSGLTSWNMPLPKLTNGDGMFGNCNSLAGWDTPLPMLEHGRSMFADCKGLISFTSDLSSLTSGDDMFRGCTALTEFNANMPKITNGSGMWSGCSSLTSFTSDLSSLTNGDTMFDGCGSLTNVTLSGSLKCNRLSFSASTALTVDSLMNIINALADRSSTSSYKLNLGRTNLAKLSEEQKAIATNKNWILS